MSEVLASVGATVGAAALIGLAAALVRLLRKVGSIEEVVCGTPADPIKGTDPVPSVGKRLADLEKATSARSALEARVAAIEAWRDEHARVCSLGAGP